MTRRTPKILLNLPSQPPATPTGVARFGLSLAAALARRGAYRYALRSAWPPEDLPQGVHDAGIELIRCPRPRRYVYDVAKQALVMPSVADRLGADLVVNLDPLGSPTGGRRRITVVHDLYFRTVPELLHPRVVLTSRLLFRLMLAGSHRLVTVSETTRSDLVRFYPQVAGRTRAVWPDTPLSITPDTPLPPPAVPWPYVLAVGAGTANKNFALLAQAMTRLDPALGTVGLVHVGADPGDVFARTFAAAARPAPLLRLINVDDARLASLYRGALCLCAPSLYEGFCLPIVEAQKQGCPVLFADRSATAEVAGSGGLGFDPTDLDGLTAALNRLAAEPELRRDLAAAGRENARRFCWKRAAANYEALFAELLAPDRSRGRTRNPAP